MHKNQAIPAHQKGDVLTNEERYFQEVHQVPVLTPQEEQASVEQARNGEPQAREALVLSCLRYIKNVAWKYTLISVRESARIEYLDVVQVGNLTAIERLDKALSHPNPLGYLRRAIAGAIIDYCQSHQGLIRPPEKNGGGYQPDYEMDSLDACAYEDNEEESVVDRLIAPEPCNHVEPDYQPLYASIERLPQPVQEVMKRHYGIGEYAPEVLYSISRDRRLRKGLPAGHGQFSDSPERKQHVRGLNALRQELAEVYAYAS